jgi:hypothetical protein
MKQSAKSQSQLTILSSTAKSGIIYTSDLAVRIYLAFSPFISFLGPLTMHFTLRCIGNSEWFKITFVIAHGIANRILRIVECKPKALHLYSLAMNPNIDKPKDIQIRPGDPDKAFYSKVHI